MSIAAAPAPPRKVFLAEDSCPMRARIAEMLASSATIVGEGDTPGRCIAGILDKQPDVVVLDVQLEGGQGLEVLKAVHAVQPAIVFVVFSNNSLPAYRKRYLQAGAARFLDKSTEFEQLAAAIQAAPAAAAAAPTDQRPS